MNTEPNIRGTSAHCRQLLSAVRTELLARARGWRNSPSDPYNIANAVQVALKEVANSMNVEITSSDWFNRFIQELDEKQRAIEGASCSAPSQEGKLFALAMASVFEGVKNCAIRALANTNPNGGGKNP